MLVCSGVGATAHVRFANVALVGAEGSSPLVELRLDGQSLVPELGYKSATGYFDVPHGMPVLSVWLAGAPIVERQLDLRNGRGYFFLVIGNGTTDAPYDLAVQYEKSYVLDVTERDQETLLLAPYPGYPRQDRVPRPAPLAVQRYCTFTNGGFNARSYTMYYPPSAFPQQWEGDKAMAMPDQKSPDKVATDEDQPANTCRIELLDQAGTGPLPPSMDPLSVLYTPQGGHRSTEILVGNGGAQAPVEWWIVSQPDRSMDPEPVAIGSSAAGIWIAPDHPGVVLNLDVSYRLQQPTTGGPALRVGTLVGILTGLDVSNQPRWNVLRSVSAITSPQQMLRTDEFIGSSGGNVNEIGLVGTLATLKFFSCTQASLKLNASLSALPMVVPRKWALSDLIAPDGASIAFQRVTPVNGSCPN